MKITFFFAKQNRFRVAFLQSVAVLIASVFGSFANAQQWQQYQDVEQAGWSQSGINDARQFASEIGSGAVIIIDNGHVVEAWGNVEYPFKAASIRKSIYDATLGAVHKKQPFNVQSTMGEMGIDDLQPLSDSEKQATLEQVMTARSGIYHPAAYETAGNAALRPPRESHDPGTFWYYNNWDFNVVCPCFKKLTGLTMQAAFEKHLAQPLELQDYKPEHVFASLEPRVSQHPAITFRISARDLARIGKLYLQNGIWDGQRVIAEDWVQKSTTAATTFEAGHSRGEGNGYGRMWWVYPKQSEKDENHYLSYRRIGARGTGGQAMVIIPDAGIVIVHLADTDRGRGISGANQLKLLQKIMAAKTGDADASATLGEVRSKRLKRQPTQLSKADYVTLDEDQIANIVGTYSVAGNVKMKFYEHDDRLFVQPIGLPYPDVELLQRNDGILGNPVVPIEFKRHPAEAKIKKIEFTFEGRTMTCLRN